MNYVAGIFEPFELWFEEDYFKTNDWLQGVQETFRRLPWYLRWLGFRDKYKCKVQDKPTRCGDFYKYQVRLEKKMLYWFKYKVFDYE